jgi:hypothetical protein
MNFNQKSDHSRVLIARILLIIFSTTLIPILPAHAITTGPSQPEVASFTPASASEMVNLFTGDFSYNIPLLDVEGYPVNISYSAGATMEQEASWVGLGWNLNPGAINREIRGLPDDYNGEIVEKQTNLKPSNTITVDVGGGLEIVGLNVSSLSGGNNFHFNLGMKANNYSGYSLFASALPTLSLGSNKDCPPFLNVSLGIGTSSADGLSLQPSLGLPIKQFSNSYCDGELSANLGLSYSSLAGLSNLSFSANWQTDRYFKTVKSNSGSPMSIAVDYNTNTAQTVNFSFLNKTYSPSLQLPMSTFGVEGKFKLGSAFLFSHFQEIVGGSFTSQFIAKENRRIKSPGYGSLYANKVQGNKDALLDFRRDNDGPVLNSTQDLAYSSTTPDIYMVSSQGIGGDYKLISGNHTYVYDPEVNSYGGAGDVGFDFGLGPGSHNGVDISATSITAVGDCGEEKMSLEMNWTRSPQVHCMRQFTLKELVTWVLTKIWLSVLYMGDTNL